MPSIRQTNFSAGELDPKLWGRTDLSFFGNGARRLRNFFVTRAGAAVSRPGTLMVVEAKLGAATPVRLFPFVYSDTQTYVLEFGEQYIRFLTDGGQLLGTLLDYEFPSADFVVGDVVTGGTSGATGTIISDINGHATLVLDGVTGTFLNGETLTAGAVSAGAHGTQYAGPFELYSPYAWADLSRLQLAQVGDVLTITHPLYTPMELRRLGATNWTMEELSFSRPGSYTPGGSYLMAPLPVATVPEPLRAWTWGVTIVYRTDLGFLTESAMHEITQTSTALWPPAGVATVASLVAVYQDLPVTVWLPVGGIDSIPAGWTAVSARIYRGRGGTFGWVGDLKAGQEVFIDVGQEPDYLDSPPQGKNPFEVYNSSNVLVRTEEPAAVAFFQERRFFGGTAERPGFWFASKTGDYANFDEHLFQVSGDALVFELAARRREDIRAFLPLHKLLAFTGSSIWSIGGQQGTPLDFDSVDAKVVEEIGSGYLRPISVEGAALYSRLKGFGVRALVPADTLNGSGFKGVDLSFPAQHLFSGVSHDTVWLDGWTIVDWCYQEDPWGLVWAARADGALLSLTYTPGSDTWAWTLHEMDGLVEAVCSVPEGNEDAVYLVVKRVIDGVDKRFIERMTSRIRTGETTDDICVDCGLEYSGAITQTISGLSHLEGKEVYFIATGNSPQGPYTVTAGEIELDEEPEANDGSNLVAYVGLLFQPELETLDLAASNVRTRMKAVTSVAVEVDQSTGLWAGQTSDKMKEWRQRTVADSYDPLSPTTTLVLINVAGRYDLSGRAVIQQRAPLPVTILGITREVDLGD